MLPPQAELHSGITRSPKKANGITALPRDLVWVSRVAATLHISLSLVGLPNYSVVDAWAAGARRGLLSIAEVVVVVVGMPVDRSAPRVGGAASLTRRGVRRLLLL